MLPTSGACTRSGRTRLPRSGSATVSIWPRLRAARETLLELARATAADPVAAGHFQDAADSYLKVPPIPPDASLDAMSRTEIQRLERAITGTGGGVYEGIEALNNSPIPFC
jgi:hypothetical protein